MRNFSGFIMGVVMTLVVGGIIMSSCPSKSTEVIPVIPGNVSVLIIDTVIIHDTARVEFERDDIIVGIRPPLSAVDTMPGDTAQAVCYKIEKAYESGAAIEAGLCSKQFTKEKPIDLTGYINYKPGNDTLSHFLRVDSVPKIIYKKPIIPTYQAIILGITAGALAALWATHK
jgi:hypothetical protein